MVLFEIVVVIVGVRTELQLLNLDHVLFLLGVVLLFLLLVAPLPIIHGFGDGWLGCGRDQDQIEPQVLRLAYGGECRHDFHRSIGKNRANFLGTNGFVYVFSDFSPAGLETSWWIHAELADGADPRRGDGQKMIQINYLAY